MKFTMILSGLALLAGWSGVPAISLAQDDGAFVVRDRLSEARERIERQQQQEYAAPPASAMEFLAAGQAEQPAWEQEEEPALTRITVQPMADSRTGPSAVQWTSTQEPAGNVVLPSNGDVYSVPTQTATSTVAATPDFAQHPFDAWGAGIAGDSPVGDGGAGWYDLPARKSGVLHGMVPVGNHVWSNTHFFDGPNGPGQGSPFAFTSAYQRSGRFPATDALGNPTDCDEWRNACGCDCCDEPFGLDIFKHKPYGPLPNPPAFGVRRCGTCATAQSCECQSCGNGVRTCHPSIITVIR